MKSMMLLHDVVAYLRDNPEAKAQHENYTVVYEKKTESIVVYHHDPSTSDVWGLHPVTHIPAVLFFVQLLIIKPKGE